VIILTICAALPIIRAVVLLIIVNPLLKRVIAIAWLKPRLSSVAVFLMYFHIYTNQRKKELWFQRVMESIN
jgi:hypothetical protein